MQEYTTIEYPPSRQFTADMGKISRDKHYVRALVEVDVTHALHRIKEIRAPGKKVSFLAWFIKTVADTTALHPPVNGIRKGRSQVVVFKSVDVSTVVEKKVDNTAVPLPLVLREANIKTCFQLNDEIQAAVAQTVENAGNFVLGKTADGLLLRLASVMPQWLRIFFMRTFILSNPQRMQAMMGTVMVTSLGTVGRMTGWIIPTSMHPLSIGIGSLNKKAAVFEGTIQKRDILHLTIAVDHDVIDGVPAFEFVDDLIRRLEGGEGLE